MCWVPSLTARVFAADNVTTGATLTQLTRPSVDVEARLLLPATSVATAAAIKAVTVPEVVMPLTATLYVEPEMRLTAPTFVPGAVPPIVTSPVPNPRTGSLKTTRKLMGETPVGSAWPGAWLIVTVGAWRSTTTEAGDPALMFAWAFPAMSLTEKLPSSVRLLVPVAPKGMDDVAVIVQTGVPVPVIEPIELMLPNVKSAPPMVDSVAQLRFSLPVSVKARLVEFVGLAVVAARVTIGI